MQHNSPEPIAIKAVHDDDLLQFMEKLGMKDSYLKGELKCVCGVVLQDNNLTAFRKQDGEPRAICNTCFVTG